MHASKLTIVGETERGYVYLRKIHIDGMPTTNASNLLPIYNGQSKLLSNCIVDAAKGRAGIDQSMEGLLLLIRESGD